MVLSVNRKLALIAAVIPIAAFARIAPGNFSSSAFGRCYREMLLLSHHHQDPAVCVWIRVRACLKAGKSGPAIPARQTPIQPSHPRGDPRGCETANAAGRRPAREKAKFPPSLVWVKSGAAMADRRGGQPAQARSTLPRSSEPTGPFSRSPSPRRPRSKIRVGRVMRSTGLSWRSWKRSSLQPGKAADKRTLIRRATYDLTGLPPTPEEVGAFVADKSPDAFARWWTACCLRRVTESAGAGTGSTWLDMPMAMGAISGLSTSATEWRKMATQTRFAIATG